MPHRIYGFSVGTQEEFDHKINRGGVTMIANADVYWGQNGTLYLVVSKKWKDYLIGATDEMPGDVLPEGSDLTFDETAFQNLFKQEEVNMKEED